MRTLLLLLLALAAPARLTLPAGTPVQISATQDVDSGSLQSGDLVAFTVTAPVVVKGVTIIPQGAAARGVAVYSRPSRVAGRGELLVEVEDVAAADGTWIPLRVRDADAGGLAGLIPEDSMDLTEAVFPKGSNGMLSAKRVLQVWTTAPRDFTVAGGKVTAVPPALGKGAVPVPEGTLVTIRPQAEISTETARTGDTVQFVVTDAVTVQGRTVIAEGAAVTGTVLLARESGRANHAGELVLGIDRVTAVDGKPLPLRLSAAEQGGANRGLSFGLSRVVPLLGLAISGRQAVVPVDQVFVVGVAGDCVVEVGPTRMKDPQ